MAITKNKELEIAYKSLIEDSSFIDLELQLKKPNLFNALGIDKYEIRHSNFLAWLLNPLGNHGLGKIFLTKILREILIDERSTHLSIIDLPSISLESALITREWKKIDILIELPETVITIENKVFSGEHSNQLDRYKKIVEEHFPKKKHVFVFLSPFGLESSMNDVFINISYRSIIKSLTEIIMALKDSMNDAVYFYIQDYINSIKEYIMEESIINDLVKKIYLNHKDLIDTILKYKPDETHDFKEALEKAVVLKGWILGSTARGNVRFLTKELNNIIPKGHGKIWVPYKESFLFELNFLYTVGKARIYATIDANDIDAAKILKPILDKVEGKENDSKQILTYKNRHHSLDISKIVNEGDESIQKEVNAIIKTAEKIVDEIELKILENKDDLLSLIKNREKNITNE